MMATGNLQRSDTVDLTFVNPNWLYMHQEQSNWASFDNASKQTFRVYTDAHSEVVMSLDRVTEHVEGSLRRESTRATSVSVEELRDEVPWPAQHFNSAGDKQQVFPAIYDGLRSPCDEQCPYEQGISRSTEAEDNTVKPIISVLPTKRKRGRPRLCSPFYDSRLSAVVSNITPARKVLLEKNRIAADKCRQRKKEQTAELSGKASLLAHKNQTLKSERADLREEVLTLKHELLRHARCGSWAIEEFITQRACSVLGKAVPSTDLSSSENSASISHIFTVDDEGGNTTSEPSIAAASPLHEYSSSSVARDDDDISWLLIHSG